MLDYGTTTYVINGREFPGAATPGAVNGPTLSMAPGNTVGSTQVSVQQEAMNDVGYRMELPTPAPWIVDGVPGMQIASSLRGRCPSDLSTVDNDTAISFRVAGLPNDRKFAKLVENHEDRHVRDAKGAYDDILGTWDRQINVFKNSGGFEARPSENPTDAFYAVVGGTPDQISQRLSDELKDRGDAFHATPDGGTPTLTAELPSKGRFGSKPLTIYCHHPLG
jgi:hypothetical protein